MEVRAVEFSSRGIGDAPMLPKLLDQIPPEQKIGSVTADGVYDGGGATIRKNAKPWKPNTLGAVTRNEALRASKYLGRALWRNWSGYHRRSRVEI